MPAAALIAAGSLGAAAIGANAASKAAKAQSSAEAQQLAFQKQVYTNAQGYLTPTINVGNNAGTALAGLLRTGGDPAAADAAFKNYLDSTNYKFLLDQGRQGIEYANAPAFSSGATAKALDEYSTGMAGNALSGYEALLAGQQGLGVQAGSALAGVGTNIAQQQANSTNAAAAATGASDIYGANGFISALRGLSNQVSNNSSYINNTVKNAFGGLFGGGNNADYGELSLGPAAGATGG